MNALTQQSDRNPFEAYGDAANSRTIVGDLLKFSKGKYSAGQNNESVPAGTQMVCNMDELLVGWIRWQDSRPTNHEMGRIIDNYKQRVREDLGDDDQDEWETDMQGVPRDPWQRTNYLLMKDVASDRLYTFTTSSKGGLGAVGELCTVHGKTVRQTPNVFPVISLEVGSYNHPNKQLGEILFPKFKVVGWLPKTVFDGLDGSAEAAPPPPKAIAKEEPVKQQSFAPLNRRAAKVKPAGDPAGPFDDVPF